MDLDENLKEVNFADFCMECKHFKTKDIEDPCNDCLEVGAREGTEAPLYFEKEDE